MSKFDHYQMVEDCAEYQEHIEREEAELFMLEEMAEYYIEQGNRELLEVSQ